MLGSPAHIHRGMPDESKPTILQPGISTNSHASKVAERLGFSEADIARHLQEKGYTSQKA